MSPEINGINGNPPSVIKRKKNRDKKVPVDNYFPATSHPYHNLSIPDVSSYYSFINCSNLSEPMSLPIYPPNYPNMNFMGNLSASKNLTVPQMNSETEYLSLPLVNMEQIEETGKRRFSDPGLPNESDSSSNSLDERVIQKMTQQINSLKENNRRLSREVTELRIEVNMLKQQSSRHYDRDYEPGMLADVIREVRDAARVREDALIARVKHLIEEKQLSLKKPMGENKKQCEVLPAARISELGQLTRGLSNSFDNCQLLEFLSAVSYHFIANVATSFVDIVAYRNNHKRLMENMFLK
ncbi:hypothetical protein JTB14_024879 [Gonioctena quinquepunctata]|nr:hypothetical protein JTB14_024879 [Gonioctena quinquepunctata]